MTPAQLQTLKTYINSQPDLSGEPNNDDGHIAVANKLNQLASPTATTWRAPGEFGLGNIIGSAGYDFTRIDNLTVGKNRIWDEVKQAINLSQFTLNLANHKAAIPAVFTTAADATTRLAIFTATQRSATRFERVYMSGNGAVSDSDGVGPVPLVLLGPVSASDVQQARNLP